MRLPLQPTGHARLATACRRVQHEPTSSRPALQHTRHLRRFNTLVGDQTGLTLQLLPMLLGFFTYKGAVLAKQSLALFGELAGSQQPGGGAEGGAEAAADNAAGEMDVASVDRAFRKRMLNEL